MQDLVLQFEEECVTFKRFIEQEGEVSVGTGCHFSAPCSSQCNNSKRPVITKSLMLLLSPGMDQRGIDRTPLRNDPSPNVQIATANKCIVFCKQFLQCLDRTQVFY